MDIPALRRGFAVAATVAVAAVAGSSAAPAKAADYTLWAKAMLRWDMAAVTVYQSDHGSYAGMTLSKLRAYDRQLSTVEIVGATRTSYCLQANVLGSWAHYRAGAKTIDAGRC